jgi:hypothetical protein
MTTTSGMPVEHAKIGPAADDCGRRWRVQPGTWVTRAHGQHSAPPSRWRRNEDRVAREKLRPEERSDEVAASPESRGAPPMRQRGRSRCRSRRTVSGHMGDTALERHDRPRALVQHTEPQRPEVDVPAAIVDQRQADHFASERLTDEPGRRPT